MYMSFFIRQTHNKIDDFLSVDRDRRQAGQEFVARWIGIAGKLTGIASKLDRNLQQGGRNLRAAGNMHYG